MSDIYFIHNYPRVEKLDYDSLDLNLVFFNKDFLYDKKVTKHFDTIYMGGIPLLLKNYLIQD